MSSDAALTEAVRAFVREVGDDLEVVCAALPQVDRDRLRRDVALDAFNLAAGLIDADGRQTDDEIGALVIATAGLIDNTDLVRATPDDVRRSGLLAGRAAHLGEVSSLFTLLLDADRRDGTRRARTYRDRAVSLAHVVASLDQLPTDDELRAIERLRASLDDALVGAETEVAAAPKPTTSTPGPDEVPPAAPPEDLPPARPLEEVMAELDRLVGLDGVKQEVHLVTDLLSVQRLRSERGLPEHESSRHLVFTGNPGTGKTTVARLLAEVYRALGVVARGHLVEVDRSRLVAGFVGQTAPRVVAAFDEADEGVLLIDEAYALARGNEGDFGKEAIDTLVKLVEDRRDRVVVIVAGYPEEMEGFIDTNPGLRSRFPRTIHFPDYTDEELVRIVLSTADKAGYRFPPEAVTKVKAWFEAQPRVKGFGNGRTARNLFEEVVGRHAQRVVDQADPSDAVLTDVAPEDVPAPDDGPVVDPA
jgi:Cdc6-like AAA superfamily ATPase